ncbi:MAG: glycosyltransferase family 4 protein [Saprospiraceae bacterium]|nr:glycosyltransferase family 4 protein [Saprospiraceae bacterium]
MKILFYNDPQLEFGGAETYWHDTAYFLVKNGVEVQKLSFEPDQNQHTWFSKVAHGPIVEQFCQAVRQFKPDLIHLNKNLLYAAGIKKALQKVNLPTIATVHDYYTIPFAINGRNHLKKRLFPFRICAQVHIVPSCHYYSKLKKHGVSDIHYIPHFVHPEKWTFNENYEGTGKKLLYVGRLEKQKGIWVLLEAMRILIKHDPGLQLIIIGQGSLERQIRSFLAHAGLHKQVVLAGGKQHHEVRQYFEQATLLIMPSIEDEMLGLVGLEAQASGLPVIASDLAGIREWCRHQATGWTVKPGHAFELAQAIRHLLADPLLRQNLRHQARVQVAREFDVGVSIQSLIRLYRQIIQSRQEIPVSTLVQAIPST